MPTPTLDGLDIFGIGVSMKTQESPRDIQLNAFNGQSGLQSLDGGGRGRRTIVTGTQVASSETAAVALDVQMRSFKDGNGHALVDTRNFAWAGLVLLEDYAPTSEIKPDANGFWLFSYQAVFQHLS